MGIGGSLVYRLFLETGTEDAGKPRFLMSARKISGKSSGVYFLVTMDERADVEEKGMIESMTGESLRGSDRLLGKVRANAGTGRRLR